MNEPQAITCHSLVNPDGPGVPVYGQTQVLNGDDIPLANYTRTCIKLRLVVSRIVEWLARRTDLLRSKPVGIPSDLPGVRVANPEKLTRQQLFDKACAAVSGWCIVSIIYLLPCFYLEHNSPRSCSLKLNVASTISESCRSFERTTPAISKSKSSAVPGTHFFDSVRLGNLL